MKKGESFFTKYSDFYYNRPSLARSKEMDLFFCWGNKEYEFLVNNVRSKSKSPYRLTGSPRLCLCGDSGHTFFKDEIAGIKSKYGRYILFATNFATANSYMSHSEYDSYYAQYSAGEIEEKDARIAQETEHINLFLDAIKKLNSSGRFNVIIRPHPGESSTFWRNSVESLANVFVESDGDITPWILASQAMVHNECTTGLQGVLSNIPTFALGDKHQMVSTTRAVPNLSSRMISCTDELMDELSNLGDFARSSFAEKELREYVAHPTSCASVKLIVGELESITKTDTIYADDLVLTADSVHLVLRKFLRKLAYKLHLTQQSITSKMDKQKRTDICISTLNSDLEKASKLLGTSVKYNTKQLKPGLVLISQ